MKYDLENVYTYHPPTDSQQSKYSYIRGNAKELAEWIFNHVPESRERSLAFTKLEEFVMWANAAIARNS